MPAIQTHKERSLTEEVSGQGSHGLGPGSSNLERSHSSSPQGWHTEQGAHFSFTLTGCLVTTREVGGRQERRRQTIKQQEDQALWLKTGPAQVLPLPRHHLEVKEPHLPPASSRPPLNLLLCTAWFLFLFSYIWRDSPLQLLSYAKRGLQKLR